MQSSPPPPSAPASSLFPFNGDFAGLAWNSQALFAQLVSKQVPKGYRAHKLIQQNDFGTFSETHSIPGRDDAVWLPPGVTAKWSHGTAAAGGLGLWYKDTFLAQFSHSSWVELEPGRVAVLRCEGANGAFDIFCVYLDCDDWNLRQNSLKIIRDNIRPKDQVLSIITGDFNFVEFSEDRWNITGEAFSGDNNGNNHNSEFFKQEFRDIFGFL